MSRKWTMDNDPPKAATVINDLRQELRFRKEQLASAKRDVAAMLSIIRRLAMNGECTCADGGPGFRCEVCEAKDVVASIESR